MSTVTLAACLGAIWGSAATLLAAVICRAIRMADWHAACPCDADEDWLAHVPAESLSDTEIAIRFADITGTRFEGLM